MEINDENKSTAKIIKLKPLVSWWKSADPCLYINNWINKLSDINIIQTKRLSDEFIQICIKEKNRIFLHINITGMGKTQFEPAIPTVKETFFQINKLINLGFPQKQILVIIDPILPNENGLRALKLLLRIFTEHRDLKLRFVRFRVLNYTKLDGNKFTIGNNNIAKRQAVKSVLPYLTSSQEFWKDYYKLIDEYQNIISVDKGEEPLIGIRELLPFGYKNEWFENGIREKIVEYERGNKFKPIVEIISASKPVRCKNHCLLCYHLY